MDQQAGSNESQIFLLPLNTELNAIMKYEAYLRRHSGDPYERHGRQAAAHRDGPPPQRVRPLADREKAMIAHTKPAAAAAPPDEPWDLAVVELRTPEP